jgi:hypothetical protein
MKDDGRSNSPDGRKSESQILIVTKPQSAPRKGLRRHPIRKAALSTKARATGPVRHADGRFIGHPRPHAECRF